MRHWRVAQTLQCAPNSSFLPSSAKLCMGPTSTFQLRSVFVQSYSFLLLLKVPDGQESERGTPNVVAAMRSEFCVAKHRLGSEAPIGYVWWLSPQRLPRKYHWIALSYVWKRIQEECHFVHATSFPQIETCRIWGPGQATPIVEMDSDEEPRKACSLKY